MINTTNLSVEADQAQIVIGVGSAGRKMFTWRVGAISWW